MQTLNANLTRETSFGRGGSILSTRDPKGLELDAIRKAAPSIFAEDKHVSRSERYTYIPTAAVLAGLLKEGFLPTEVRQGGSRDEEKRGFTKHMIRLRREPESNNVYRARGGHHFDFKGELFPEVVLVNSHDGTSAYQLYAGLFRLVCTNGLISGEMFQSVKIAHKGNVVDQVIEGAYTVVDTALAMGEQARQLEGIQLTRDEQTVFGRAALALRFEEPEKAPVQVEQVLRPRRAADNKPDLWTTFNRTQENLIKGGLHGVTVNAETRQRRHVTTRPVNGIEGNRDLNRALHTLATEFAKLKQAA